MDDNTEPDIQTISFKEKCANNAYYIVIAILSLLALTFLPLLGSTVGLALNIPTTIAGWIVYVVTKLIVCVLNMMIFHSFVKQAKINAERICSKKPSQVLRNYLWKERHNSFHFKYFICYSTWSGFINV